MAHARLVDKISSKMGGHSQNTGKATSLGQKYFKDMFATLPAKHQQWHNVDYGAGIDSQKLLRKTPSTDRICHFNFSKVFAVVAVDGFACYSGRALQRIIARQANTTTSMRQQLHMKCIRSMEIIWSARMTLVMSIYSLCSCVRHQALADKNKKTEKNGRCSVPRKKKLS